jgi:phosphoglycolate phosphatase-like HAD superfamily hydrolase
MGIAPQEALLVGDSMDDVRAGYAAGVDVAIVDRGEPITFDSTYPFYRLNSLWKLRSWIVPQPTRFSYASDLVVEESEAA